MRFACLSFRVVVVVLALFAFAGGSAEAANQTWDGGSVVDGNWATLQNWVGDAGFPGVSLGGSITNTDTALFNAAIANTWGNAVGNPIVLPGSFNIQNINFNTAAGNFFIGSTGGNAAFVTNAGKIEILSTLTATNATETINAPISLRAPNSTNGTFSFLNNSANGAGAGAGTLVIGGSVIADQNTTTNSMTLTLGGTNTNANTVSGVMQNGGGGRILTVNKTGAGTWVLAGSNTYSGTTTVTAGTLVLSNALALQNSALVTTGAGTITLTGVTTPTIGGLSGATGDLATIISSGYGGVTNLTLNPAGAFDYGGVIANGAAGMTLTKTGAGTQTLSGANTYSGTTTVNAGTLQLGNGGTTGSLNTASALSFAANTNFQINQTDTVTQGVDFSGAAFTGNVNLIKAGTGNVVLTGANTVRELRVNNATGAVDIGATSLFVNNGGANAISSTTGGTINGTGVLIFPTLADNSTAPGTLLTINPQVQVTTTGIFEYCCSGGGTIFLANNTNNFTGGVVINTTNGKLRFSTVADTGTNSGLGNSGVINLNSAGSGLEYVGTTNSSTNRTLNVSSTATIDQMGTGNLTFTGTFTGGAGAKTLTLQGSTAGTGEISSIIGNGGGTQAIAKSGTGTWTLSGNNTFTGGVTVNAGTLRVGNAGALNSGTPNAVVMSGGTLQLNGNSIAVGGLSAMTGGTVENAHATPVTLNANLASDTAFAGVLQDGAGGGALSLQKSGAGTLYLGNNSTYTGATTISGGTLRLAPTALTVTGSQFWLDANTTTAGAVSSWTDSSGNLRTATQGTAANQPTSTTSGLLGGKKVVSFDGADDFLSVGGTGFTFLTGSSYSMFAVEGREGSGNHYFLGSGTGGLNQALHVGYQSSTTFRLGQFSNDLDYLAVPAFTSQTFRVWDSVLNTAVGHSIFLNGGQVVSNANVTPLASGAGGVVGRGFNGCCSYNGDLAEVIIFNSALSVADRAAVEAYLGRKWFGAAAGSNILPATTALSLTASGATLDLFGNNQTIGSLSGVAGSSVTNSLNLLAPLPVTLTINPASGSTTFSGVISDNANGALSLVKNGAGTQVLAGANTYRGTTTINNGTLQINDESGLGANPGAFNAGHLTINGGTLRGSATFAIDDANRGITLGASGGTIEIDNTFGVSIDSPIAGSGSLTRTGGGTLHMTGANTNTYTGQTIVNDGILNLARTLGGNKSIAGDGPGSTPDLIVNTNGTVRISASEQIADNGHVVVQGGTLTFNGTGITETIGTLTVNSGTFTTGTGTGNLLRGIGNTVNWNGGVSTITDVNTVQDEHWVVTGGTNTVNNGVSGGTLHVDAPMMGPTGLHFGGTASPTITLNDGGAAAGRILLENNVFVDVSLTAGTAQILSDGTNAAVPGRIDMSGGSRTFDINDGSAGIDMRISARLENGTLVKTGAGTLEFSGGASNTHTTTTVNAGTLRLNKTAGVDAVTGTLNIGDNIGADTVILDASNQINDLTNVNINSSATLNRNGNSDAINALNLTSGTVSGGGTLTLGGTVTSNLISTIGGGNLNLGGNRDFNVGNGTLTVNDVIQGAGNDLTKTGAATMIVTNNNTYSGSTNVNDGTFILASGGLQNSAVNVNAPGIFRQNGGTNNVTGGVGVGNMSIGANAEYELNAGELNFGDTAGAGAHHPTLGPPIATESSLNIAATGTFDFNGGRLVDITNINPASGTFTQNGGTFVIGQDVGGAPTPDFAAITTINGVFDMNGGVLLIDIFGPEATPTIMTDAEPIDLLIATAGADLNGIIDLEFGTYQPLFGDIFSLVKSPTFTFGPGFGISDGFQRVVPDGMGGFVLQAIVPEPGTVAMWSLLALAGLVGARRLRRKV